MKQGDFTLPGEAGYEKLTLELAKKWGADVIRDSDGTHLSDEIVNAGYGIYSTICIIRQHNAFAAEHPDAQQQTFLCSDAVTATEETVTLDPLAGYFREQFEMNETPEALRYMQVMDRTTGKEVARESWEYRDGKVFVHNARKWHRYTVSFLVWRIWEEINMYNHTTNNWTTEHLRQLDPRHPLAWEYLQKWLEDWCAANPDTTVIRFTSLFYNFVWIFGEDMRRRNRFTDWASYDFTVSPAALDAFREEYGYALNAEDFVNGGKLQVTHMPPTQAKRDYMAMIHRFVAEKAKVLTEIAHRYGKLAYVFCDDSWVGMEPYGPRFAEMGFDGLIKCVFSGFECRFCADVNVPTHEIRLHPYLFPVGLGGLPTFAEGGDPARDAMEYWRNTRRALARRCVDRIGLGGYLHLTLDFPEFNDTIERIADEFRRLKELQKHGAPAETGVRVAVMHTWGGLRPWTLSGHFHETDRHDLIHINEALSGLPVHVEFITFEDAENGALDRFDAVINAGRAGDAWSGGDVWKNEKLTEKVTEFVWNGGTLIGVGQPTAAEGGDTFFRLAHVLGIDQDRGARVCHGKWAFDVEADPEIPVVTEALGNEKDLYLTGPGTRVLYAKDGVPQMTVNRFGKGRGVYMSAFRKGTEANDMLLRILLGDKACEIPWICDRAGAEAAYYPADKVLLVMNATDEKLECSVRLPDGNALPVSLESGETKEIEI